NQRVAVLVMADRMSPPLRIGIVGMLAVQPHDAEVRTELIENVDSLWSLYELGLDRPQINVWHAGRLTVQDLGIARFAELGIGAGRRLLRECFLARPRLIRNVVFLPSLATAHVR